MPITPPAIVAGPPRIPLPYGLFSAVSFRDGSPDRWMSGGVTWETLGCLNSNSLTLAEGIVCETVTLEMGEGDNSLGGTAQMFSVYANYQCSPIGRSLADAYDIAADRLELFEEAAVESQLWNALLEQVEIAAGPTNAWEAVSQLENNFAEVYGSLGVMHMSRKMASWLTKNGELTNRGGKLFTGLGTPVVASASYSESTIAMTSQLVAYRSDVMPGPTPNTDGSFLDRSTNDLTAVAGRNYLIGFDDCALMAMSTTFE